MGESAVLTKTFEFWSELVGVFFFFSRFLVLICFLTLYVVIDSYLLNGDGWMDGDCMMEWKRACTGHGHGHEMDGLIDTIGSTVWC